MEPVEFLKCQIASFVSNDATWQVRIPVTVITNKRDTAIV